MNQNSNNAPVVVKRQLIPGLLAGKFISAYHESIIELPLDRKIELTEHLLGTMDLLKAYAEAEDEKIFKEYGKQEEALLKKFGKALKLYRQKSFHKFFFFGEVLAEMDILTTEQYNRLPAEEQRPSEREINQFVSITKNRLNFERNFLFLERDPEFELTEKVPIKSGISWTGNKDSKNDFVQMVYGLHRAGIINAGKGEITKIVEALAPVFNVELGKNWQSNHSASIHKVNRNYQPPVFDKIKEAYLKYAEGLLEDKKKKQ